MRQFFGFLSRFAFMAFAFFIIFPLALVLIFTIELLEGLENAIRTAWEAVYGDICWASSWRHLRTGGVE